MLNTRVEDGSELEHTVGGREMKGVDVEQSERRGGVDVGHKSGRERSELEARVGGREREGKEMENRVGGREREGSEPG